MHRDHKVFIDALENRMKVEITFSSKEDGETLKRLCAPMDFGPSRRAKDGLDRYHSWDYGSDERPHSLSLLPNAILRISATDEEFDPKEFVTWDLKKSPWFHTRDWGRHS